MKMRFVTQTLGMALLAVALQTGSIAQQKFPDAVTIATPAPVVASGAEIKLNVTVVNTSDQTIRVIKALGPDGQAEAVNHVEIYDAEGKKLSWIPSHQTWISRKTVSVEPGKSCDDFLILSNLFDLSKPGKYTVIVRHELMQPDALRPEDRRIYIPSNTLMITVTE